MRTSKIAKEERASKKEALKALLTLKQTEERNFTEDEVKQFNDFEAEIKNFDAEIAQLEKEEATAMRLATPVQLPADPQGEKEDPSARFMKDLRGAIAGNGTAKMKVSPDALRVIGTSADGGAIASQSKGFIESLLPFMAVGAMKPNVYSNLEGAGDLIVAKGKGAIAKWVGEGTAMTGAGGGFDGVVVARKTLSTTVLVNNSYALATSFSANQKMADQLRQAIAIALNATVLNGGGTNEPKGIITTTGVTAITNAAVDASVVVDLKKEVRKLGINNAEASFVFSPDDYSTLEDTSRDTGSGAFVITENGKVHGMQALMDGSLAEGSVIAGDGSGIHIGQWGDLRLTIDPITLAENDQTKITINMTCGVGIDPSRFVINKTA